MKRTCGVLHPFASCLSCFRGFDIGSGVVAAYSLGRSPSFSPYSHTAPCAIKIQQRRFREDLSLRRLYREVARFAAAWGVLTFGFYLLTFDLRVRRALCTLLSNVVCRLHSALSRHGVRVPSLPLRPGGLCLCLCLSLSLSLLPCAPSNCPQSSRLLFLSLSLYLNLNLSLYLYLSLFLSIGRAGTPTTVTPGGTDLVTAAPVPTDAAAIGRCASCHPTFHSDQAFAQPDCPPLAHVQDYRPQGRGEGCFWSRHCQPR